MIAILKVVRVSSSSILLLALCNMPQVVDLASAANEMKESPCEMPPGQNAEQHAMRKGHMISGEVLRVDSANYIVKEESGKEVRIRTDESTANPLINQGDYISADVDDQNRALWIRARSTDRRNEHAEQHAMREGHMISGEVLRVGSANYIVKEKSGKEVRVRADESTAKPSINQGDHISADVDDQNRALWIRANRSTDRRIEHASAIRHRAVLSSTDRR